MCATLVWLELLQLALLLVLLGEVEVLSPANTPNLCLRFFLLRRINNAGEVTAKRLLADVEAAEVVRVVGTNVLGSLLG